MRDEYFKHQRIDPKQLFVNTAQNDVLQHPQLKTSRHNEPLRSPYDDMSQFQRYFFKRNHILKI